MIDTKEDGCDSDSCIECGGKLRWDHEHGHSYCEECGLVRKESDLYLSRQKGDGSLSSVESLKQEIQFDHSHRKGGNARTSFHADDAERSDKYKKLWMHHHQYSEDCREKSSQTDRDKVRLAHTLAIQLYLPDRIIGKVKNIVANLNGRSFNRIGGIYAMALGTIAVVQNQTIETEEEFRNRIQVRHFDEGVELENSPLECEYSGKGEDSRDKSDKPLFKKLCEEYDVDFRSAMRRVKEQL
ncbi:hypothetical protein JMJ58_00750 [Haloterrigena salifodinae]|uniref:Uncharacterized protein n=1 Tax=Haloterrigena salifodinae TaxID=2675099 RepID=A0A8T8E0W7_9EURY|nr:hypothetical protein [Haloterrigena salifodinae]QRV15464.1 hypothetical protein JMJ58_00750 [Haloterrigena salifodinae]